MDSQNLEDLNKHHPHFETDPNLPWSQLALKRKRLGRGKTRAALCCACDKPVAGERGRGLSG